MIENVDIVIVCVCALRLNIWEQIEEDIVNALGKILLSFVNYYCSIHSLDDTLRKMMNRCSWYAQLRVIEILYAHFYDDDHKCVTHRNNESMNTS